MAIVDVSTVCIRERILGRISDSWPCSWDQGAKLDSAICGRTPDPERVNSPSAAMLPYPTHTCTVGIVQGTRGHGKSLGGPHRVLLKSEYRHPATVRRGTSTLLEGTAQAKQSIRAPGAVSDSRQGHYLAASIGRRLAICRWLRSHPAPSRSALRSSAALVTPDGAQLLARLVTADSRDGCRCPHSHLSEYRPEERGEATTWIRSFVKRYVPDIASNELVVWDTLRSVTFDTMGLVHVCRFCSTAGKRPQSEQSTVTVLERRSF
ncbi:uncharacterized protein DSM5745_10380 [Aspergillus mulundensis]|uniref:Uncharacterized protein n=1 Tax=Aspergillus mulundensis TaxID=1810919 RepID=A0A3D8QJ19_9EURO|nr:hypothetical protein DSM5745_10380 [Aspergillus mulundensis]RDW61708.1 hypothetical protein DSM5745_10380 [Aspergillus mulundensis]